MSTIILTEAAAYEVKSMMEKNGLPNGYLRISVKGGGCTGLSYGMSAETESSADDEVLEYYGVKVLINKEDAPILKGTTVDFKQSLMGGGFSIENPNAIASCGCGSSFRTKNVAGTPENC